MITVTRTSMMTGVERSRDLDITSLQLNEYETGRRTIQACFPHLSPSDREFIMTGITDDEWGDAFSGHEGD